MLLNLPSCTECVEAAPGGSAGTFTSADDEAADDEAADDTGCDAWQDGVCKTGVNTCAGCCDDGRGDGERTAPGAGLDCFERTSHDQFGGVGRICSCLVAMDMLACPPTRPHLRVCDFSYSMTSMIVARSLLTSML